MTEYEKEVWTKFAHEEFKKRPVVKVQSPLTDEEIQEEIKRHRIIGKRRDYIIRRMAELRTQLKEIDRREDGQSVASNMTETNSENGGPQKMSNSKLQRVNPLVETAQYVRGTEPGHFYLITNDLSNAIIGFRPLALDYAPIGGRPVAGIETRVRIVPKVTLTDRNAQLLNRLGNLTRKIHNGEVHYSVVTNDAPQVIKDALLILS